jgi:hypothetical protein
MSAENIAPTRIRSRDRPDRSESLYRHTLSTLRASYIARMPTPTGLVRLSCHILANPHNKPTKFIFDLILLWIFVSHLDGRLHINANNKETLKKKHFNETERKKNKYKVKSFIICILRRHLVRIFLPHTCHMPRQSINHEAAFCAEYRYHSKNKHVIRI